MLAGGIEESRARRLGFDLLLSTTVEGTGPVFDEIPGSDRQALSIESVKV
jgi:hypothetical protein